MERLDALIVGLGLVPSRSKAQRLIRDGHVLVDGVAVTKPAANVATASSITVDKGDDYVSRGAYKLIGAFDEFFGRGLRRAACAAWTSVPRPAASATCCCAGEPLRSSPWMWGMVSSIVVSRATRASSR